MFVLLNDDELSRAFGCQEVFVGVCHSDCLGQAMRGLPDKSDADAVVVDFCYLRGVWQQLKVCLMMYDLSPSLLRLTIGDLLI